MTNMCVLELKLQNDQIIDLLTSGIRWEKDMILNEKLSIQSRAVYICYA